MVGFELGISAAELRLTCTFAAPGITLMMRHVEML